MTDPSRTFASPEIADREPQSEPDDQSVPPTEPVERLREELIERVHRQADRVQQTAADVQEETHRRVATVQQRASQLRTQLKFQREKRDPIRYRLSIATAWAVSWFASVLPHPVRMAIAMVIGSVVFRFNRAFRANVRDNLRHVLGPDADPAKIEATAHSISRNGILNFLDLLMMKHRTSEQALTDIEMDAETVRRIEAHRTDERGMIVLTGHLGSFDMIGMALTSHDYPCTVLTGRTTFRVFFDAVAWLRGSHGGVVVEPTPSGVREVYRSLRRGAMVGIVSDRDFFLNGLPVTFFGAETTLPQGAARIARDTGVMILPLFARREGRRHILRSHEPFGVPRTADAAADIREGMRKVVAALEREIGNEPEQWSIFQRVWPDDAISTRPADGPATAVASGS